MSARPLSERRESPESGSKVTLLVRVSDSSSEDVLKAIQEEGGEIDKVLGHDFLRVTILEESLDGLISLETTNSVEIEGHGKTLTSGNSNSRFDSSP